VSLYQVDQQHGFAWEFILLTYFHVGQLLFADKKYILLKRITVQSREKTLLRNMKSKRPLLPCAHSLVSRRKPCKHRTTMHPTAFSPIKNEALPTPWLG
jgi:hypothetical protein